MQPDVTKVWSRSEILPGVRKILVESLGVDETTATEAASLVGDLGAESIDFLDISFKCQQTFGVDLPARLIQDRVIEWRDLRVLSRVVTKRHGLSIPPESLRTIAPATVAAVLQYLETNHGLSRSPDDAQELVLALAEQLLADLDGMGLDLSDLQPERLAVHLLENLHSPVAMDEVMNRFTVGALVDYIAGQLAKAGRLTTET